MGCKLSLQLRSRRGPNAPAILQTRLSIHRLYEPSCRLFNNVCSVANWTWSGPIFQWQPISLCISISIHILSKFRSAKSKLEQETSAGFAGRGQALCCSVTLSSRSWFQFDSCWEGIRISRDTKSLQGLDLWFRWQRDDSRKSWVASCVQWQLNMCQGTADMLHARMSFLQCRLETRQVKNKW